MKWSQTEQGQLTLRARELLFDDRNAEGAVELLDKALELEPDNHHILTYQGVALHELGRFEEADRSLRKAVGINSDDMHAWNALGMLNEDQEFFERAAFCYEQSVRISVSVENLTVLANVQLVFDPHSSARNAELAMALEGDHEETRVILESAHRELRKQTEE